LEDKNHVIKSFSEMASRYESLMNSELNRFWGFNYAEFVKELINEIVFDRNQQVLDIATGTAFIPQSISNEGKLLNELVGLDITFEMLHNAKKQIAERQVGLPIHLVCGSAHELPFRNNSFDITTCCLATHHMDIDLLMNQTFESLKPNGKFHIADVGASTKWKSGFVKFILKAGAFFYFLFIENYSRAKAESEAVENIYTVQEWHDIIKSHGFIDIKIRELKSRRFWAPNPIIIEARKP